MIIKIMILVVSFLVVAFLAGCPSVPEIANPQAVDISTRGNLFSSKISSKFIPNKTAGGYYSMCFVFVVPKGSVDFPAYEKFSHYCEKEHEKDSAFGWPKGFDIEIKIKDWYGEAVQHLRINEDIIRNSKYPSYQAQIGWYSDHIPNAFSNCLDLDKYIGCYQAVFSETVSLYSEREYVIEIKVLEPSKDCATMYLAYSYMTF